MAERQRLTLLQLAIAASTAVVPVLLAVLLIVAAARQADGAKPTQNSDRHVSVRHVAALKTFEYAIIRRDRVTAGPPSAEALLERFPQCRSAWDGRGTTLNRMRRFIARSPDESSSVAVRMALQLDELDQALFAFSTGDNRRVSDAVGIDSARWFDAVATALQAPIETPDYPGVLFTVQCADIAGAVSTLARANGRMLAALSWRGTEVDRVIARWRPEQFVEISARSVARANPWSGIRGCVYFASAKDADANEERTTYFLGGARGQDDRLCKRADMRGIVVDNGHTPLALRLAGEPSPDMPVGDERWMVPPSLGTMLQPLERLRRPSEPLYLAHTAAATEPQSLPGSYRYGPNRIAVGGAPIDVGFSIDLTIDPSLQALAQQTAACYTGREDVCHALDIRRKEDGSQGVGHGLLEHAMVRMAAVAIIDVESGRIEALAGALSPCTREEYDGPGRSTHCDKRLPYPIRYRPDALLNPAVFHDAMPGSIIKPIMAAAFLSDPTIGARWLSAERAEISRLPAAAIPSAESLRGQLMRSNSARFLDRMFCADKGFAPCERPWEIQAMAPAFGWNGGCGLPSDECGKRDLLFGRTIAVQGGDGFGSPLALAVPYGRLLTEPLGGKLGAPMRIRPPTQLDAARVRQCAAGPDGQRMSKDDWEKCSGGVVVDIVAEGWGQGQARASALGGAGMIAMLAAAANGQTEVYKPHLVQAVRGAGPANISLLPWSHAEAESNRISRDAAEVIISGLSFSHRAGTARLACEQVFDARTCAQMDWIAGKTGTPTFPNDDRSLDDLAQLCTSGAIRLRRDRDACGPLRPYKWYVAAYRTNPADPRWNKVIGVLTERNWLADTGRVHGAGDHGPNPAAEIAMQIAGRHAGVLAQSAVVAQGTK
jgi:hypothetical protein